MSIINEKFSAIFDSELEQVGDLIPDGKYKYSIWVRGLSVVVRTVYITIKNTEVQGVSYE